MKGVSYLFFLRDLIRKVDEDWPGVLASLEHMRQTLVSRQNIIINVTCDEQDWSAFNSHLDGFLKKLPADGVQECKWSPDKPADFEGMIIPAQVNYVGKGANLYQLGYRLHGSAHVISRYRSRPGRSLRCLLPIQSSIRHPNLCLLQRSQSHQDNRNI
jgi:Zn-dependent M16 (insulinase) family peptidase